MYKRQGYGDTRDFSCDTAPFAEYADEIRTLVIEDGITYIAVSYTHLDVYKRQNHYLQQRQGARILSAKEAEKMPAPILQTEWNLLRTCFCHQKWYTG